MESRRWGITLIILATKEADMRRIAVQSQSWANSSQDSISKKKKTTKQRLAE
jgi:hypothetical protein